MTIVAVLGDCTTTTCVALAAGWSVDDDLVVIEADPAGGSLTGWLDTPASPSLATIVANVANAPSDVASTITSLVQRSSSGVRFVPTPLRAVPASRAIHEAATTVFPWLASNGSIALCDVGRHQVSGPLPTVLDLADATLIVHRQETASAAAAAVRLERLVETIEVIGATSTSIVVAIIGTEPFDPDEIRRYLHDACPDVMSGFVELADDPLGAAVLAGRTGVSAKRLRRLPLLRSVVPVAGALRRCVQDRHGVLREAGT